MKVTPIRPITTISKDLPKKKKDEIRCETCNALVKSENDLIHGTCEKCHREDEE